MSVASKKSGMSGTSDTSLEVTDKELVKILGSNSLWFRVKKVARVDLFFLLVNIVIGSQFDMEFAGGFWDSIFNLIFTGFGYIFLASSMAEMSSALPFSGGIYGIVRAFVHPMLGFVIACFELLVSFLYISANVHTLSQVPVEAGHIEKRYTLVVVFIIYVILAAVCILGGKVFWYTSAGNALLILLFITIFILGSIKSSDFDKYDSSNDEVFEMPATMKSMPVTTMTFIGIQLLPLSSKYTKDAKQDVPMVMMYSMMLLVVVAVLVFVMASSQYPGANLLDEEIFPLSSGFMNMFHISYNHAVWMSLPGMFGTCLGFMFCFGRQATCMAGSGLLPSILKKHIPIVHTPWVALIAMAAGSYMLNVLLYVFEEHLMDYFVLLCVLASFVVYIAFFVSYLQFQSSHTSIHRNCNSPFGKAGGYMGIIIFLTCIVGTLGFQPNDYIPAVILIGFTLMVLGIFWVFLRGTHEFSDEEKEELFKAYLINANRATKARNKKGRNSGGSVGSAASNPGTQNGPRRNATSLQSHNHEGNVSMSSMPGMSHLTHCQSLDTPSVLQRTDSQAQGPESQEKDKEKENEIAGPETVDGKEDEIADIESQKKSIAGSSHRLHNHQHHQHHPPLSFINEQGHAEAEGVDGEAGDTYAVDTERKASFFSSLTASFFKNNQVVPMTASTSRASSVIISPPVPEIVSEHTTTN